MKENIENAVQFYFDWLYVSDYAFRIIALVRTQADHLNTYKGTLKNMREWLNISENADNNRKIKNAIEELAQKNLIQYSIQRKNLHHNNN